MSTLQEINEQIDALKLERSKIEQAEAKEWAKRPPFKIGATEVYRNNCYSCPEPDEHWDSYRKLIMIQQSAGALWLIFEKVEIDYRGKVTIDITERFVSGPANAESAGWEPCSVYQYEHNRKRAFRELAKPKTLANWLKGSK